VKKKSAKVLILSLLMTAMLPLTVFAGDDVSENFAGNFFEAGSIASVSDVKAKDIFAAGRGVSVSDSNSSGNIFTAGSSVEISDVEVLADVFAAGQMVSVKNNNIDGNIFAAGQSVVINESQASSVIVAAASVEYLDTEAEVVKISAESITFNGVAYGDVDLTGENIVIGDDAVIKGTLTVNSSVEAQISDSASVEHYKFNEVIEETAENAKKVSVFTDILSDVVSRAYWIPAAALIALLLAFVFGKQLDEAKELIMKKPLAMVLTGALTWLFTPVVIILVAVTIIGAPLGALVGIVYVFLILLGLTFAGASLGRLAFPKLNPILASVIGVAILQCVRIIPFIGTVIAAAADMYLLGYAGLKIYDNIPKKEKKSVVYAQALEEPPVLNEASKAEAALSADSEVPSESEMTGE